MAKIGKARNKKQLAPLENGTFKGVKDAKSNYHFLARAECQNSLNSKHSGITAYCVYHKVLTIPQKTVILPLN